MGASEDAATAIGFRQQSRRGIEAGAGKQGEPRRLSNLWQWLVTGALALERIVHIIQDLVVHVSRWFGGPGQAHAGSATLSTKTSVGVAVGCGAVTVGTVVTVAALTGLASASVVGPWREVGGATIVVVEETDSGYVGRNTKDLSDPATGCVWKAGLPLWRLRGDGRHFDGQVRWGYGGGGECTEFNWYTATFELDDRGTPDDRADDLLRWCTASAPTDERCFKYSRA